MRLKRFVLFLSFILFIIFIYFKIPNDTKDSSKLNEIVERINEIEKLIKVNRRNFDLIKNAILETKVNGSNMEELKNFKAMLNFINSQTYLDASTKQLKWNHNLYNICPKINFTKSDVDMTKLYETLDFTNKDGGVWKQGFDIQYKIENFIKKKLKVFVIPHSHQDPGWIKTFDEYFNEETKATLDNMLDFLTKEPNMKFIYAEVVYFAKWWDTIDETKRKQVRRLLKNKQFEIVTGGWVMTDEATTHYFSMINQLTEGHTWLKTNLDYIPLFGWAIDPFGYSQSMPYILKKGGIDSMVIQRVHYSVKKYLSLHNQLEFYWKQYWDSENKHIIRCHAMPFFSYDVPHTCGPDPSICCQFDFIRMINYPCPWGKSPEEISETNVEERAEMLLDQYRKKASLFDNGNVLLVPLGDDFRYKTEKEWNLQFTNYNKLMKYMNSRQDWHIEVKFGILSDYFDEIKKQNQNTFPLLTGDMFSYSDREDHYWTGYFTSRPFLKILDRILMTNLRTAEIVLSLSLIYHKKYKHSISNVFNETSLVSAIRKCSQEHALFQHHDVITGTSKSYVVIDYEKRALEAIDSIQNVFIRSAQSILQNNDEKNKIDHVIFDVHDLMQTYNEFIEENFIDLISNNERYVYLFNSLSQPRQVIVNIPIHTHSENEINIVGSGNQFIKCQISPFLNDQKANHSRHYVSFKLNIGPLAFEKVKIKISNDILSENNCLLATINLFNMEKPVSLSKNYKVFHKNRILSEYIMIENSLSSVFINSSTGFIEQIKDHINKKQFKLNIFFRKYGVRRTRETSGAYLFIPDGDGEILESNTIHSFIHIQGNIYEEIIVKTHHVTHSFKIYKVDGLLANAMDIKNVIDITQESNFEISMVIQTDFVDPSDQFYIDSNCFQFVRKRTLKKLPIQANVYPMSCGAYLESAEGSSLRKISLFSRQSGGLRAGKSNFGKQSVKGYLEVFQDRIISQDDNRGLFESMVDNKVVSNKYRLLLEEWKQENHMDNNLGELTNTGYQILNDLIYPLHQIYVKPNFNNEISSNLVGQKSLLTGFGFPCDYHMVNMKTNIGDFPILVIHRLKVNCKAGYISEGSCKFSKKQSPLLKSMFDDLTIKFVHKFFLTGITKIETDILPEDVRINLMEIETLKLHFDY